MAKRKPVIYRVRLLYHPVTGLGDIAAIGSSQASDLVSSVNHLGVRCFWAPYGLFKKKSQIVIVPEQNRRVDELVFSTSVPFGAEGCYLYDSPRYGLLFLKVTKTGIGEDFITVKNGDGIQDSYLQMDTEFDGWTTRQLSRDLADKVVCLGVKAGGLMLAAEDDSSCSTGVVFV